MKKFALLLIMIFCGINVASAKDMKFILGDDKDVADTTIISNFENKKVSFDIDVYTNKAGEVKQYFYCIIDGVVYTTNKSTFERWMKYEHYGLKPAIAIIRRGKAKARVVIL